MRRNGCNYNNFVSQQKHLSLCSSIELSLAISPARKKPLHETVLNYQELVLKTLEFPAGQFMYICPAFVLKSLIITYIT